MKPSPYTPPKTGKWYRLPADPNDPFPTLWTYRRWDAAAGRYQDKIVESEMTPLLRRDQKIVRFGPPVTLPYEPEKAAPP